jgi:hypothetical protein
MALVIFCVAFTEAMRLRRSFRLGIERPYPSTVAVVTRTRYENDLA